MLQKIINRPVLATVVSIILVFLGVISLTRLPITRFPDVAPPTVSVSGTYPGGNSESVSRSVIIPLEEAINGVENMDYITSSAGNDGSFSITIIFKLGTNPDQAAVNVQNRVSQVNSLIPAEVTKAGITTSKRQNSNIMQFNLVSNDASKYDELFLQNYAKINLIPAIKRISGIGEVQLYGVKDYSMRIWLDPQKMTVHKLTPTDIEAAIGNASFEASPGTLGMESEAPMQYVIKYSGKLNDPKRFEQIVIKAKEDGSMLRLKDVGRVEFGSSSYSGDSKQDGMPAVTLSIQQISGSNANEIVTHVNEALEHANQSFPSGISCSVISSSKDKLDQSISQIKKTLIEAFFLVFIVVFIFLQDIRSTIIPAIAVPVSIVGTFFLLQLVGFSINVLTLFALVLAIGIVVDDAIVVVEAVHSKIAHEKLDKKSATKAAMSEISSAIISITLVMTAVFLPVAFMEGPAGIFYKQFALTLAFAILISALNALTLSPALCALFLNDKHEEGDTESPNLKKRFFNAFNVGFKVLSDKYIHTVSFTLRKKWLSLGALGIITALAFFMMSRSPKDFIPMEDDGLITYSLSLPSGTNLQYTTEVVSRIDSIIKTMPSVDNVTSITGFNILSLGAGSSYALGFTKLKLPKERGKIQNMDEIIEKMNAKLSVIKEGELNLFRTPPVDGFGTIGGAELVLQDKTGEDISKFNDMAQGIIANLQEDPSVAVAFTSFRSDYPQFEVVLDEDKAYQLNTTPREVLSTLSLFYGGSQASDFVRYGKFYRVNIKAEGQYRMDEQSLSQVYVRNSKNEMIPISTLVKLNKVYGPDNVTRYNLFNSITVNVMPAAGYSNGQVIENAEKLLKEKLPEGYGFEWSGLSREEKKAGNQMAFILALCIAFTYLLLAAQYESYILPLAVILSIPTGLFGVYLFTGMAGISNNIYVQIGIIMLIGLLAKNAILIVEFAVQARKKGAPVIASAREGARLRFRPILMTSLAFIIGLVPLVFATGPAAVGNHSISIGTIGGMLSGVVIGLLFIPVLYVVFQLIHDKITGKKIMK
nr:efflux RND transporter permease subunit [uncultured Bacteroides sp.]